MKNKGKTWPRATNSRLRFGVKLNLNLSIDRKNVKIFAKFYLKFVR